MYCSIIEESGEVIEFDVSKICDAILKAFAGLGELVDEIIGNIRNTLSTFAHSLAHCLLHGFHRLVTKTRAQRSADRQSAAWLASVVRTCVSCLTLSYLEHRSLFLRSYLLRSQDRGSNDDRHSDEVIGISKQYSA